MCYQRINHLVSWESGEINGQVAIGSYRIRIYEYFPYGSNSWGPLPRGPRGPWTPQNQTGGCSNRFGPHRFNLKNIKILCENKRINNSFENSSLVVTVSKHFSKFSENFFHILRIILFFIYSEFLNILTCIFS